MRKRDRREIGNLLLTVSMGLIELIERLNKETAKVFKEIEERLTELEKK